MAEPQLCNTDVMPMRAPRCFGSAAMVSIVSDEEEQQIVDHGLVLIGDVTNRRRQGEDDVEVGNREQFGFARRHPQACCRALALRAVPVAAAVVGDRGVGTVLAARDVSAEGHRAAALDGAHHLELEQADVAAVGKTPRGPVVAEDLRDLQS